MSPGIDARDAGIAPGNEAPLSTGPLPHPPGSQSKAATGTTVLGGRAVDLLVLAFILAVTLIYFWRFVDPWSPDPAHFPPGDLTEQFYPYHHYAIAELSDGRLPVWSPYANAGQPFIGDIQTAVLYPPGLLLAWLLIALGQPDLSFPLFEWFIILHYVLAALGFFVFVRTLTRSRTAGLVSAMAFTFGGLMTSYPPQQTAIIQSMVWLPFTLLFVRQAFVRGQARYFMPALASMCVSILGGHPQTAAFGLYLTAAYGLWNAVINRQHHLQERRDSSPATVQRRGEGDHASRKTLWVLVAFGLTFVLAIALAAGQLGATAELWQLSRRVVNSYDFTQAGFPAFQYIGLLFPAAVGGHPMYVGFFALLLAVLALARGSHRDVLFWALTAIVTYVLSFGGLTPLYPLARLMVPGYGMFRNQERAIYLTAVAVAVLAGYGAAWLLSSGPRGRRGRLLLGLTPVLLLAVGFAIASPDRRAILFSPNTDSIGFPSPAVRLPLVVLASTMVLYLSSSRLSGVVPRLRRSFLTLGLVVLLLPILAGADNLSTNWNSLLPSADEPFPQAPAPVADFLRRAVTDGRVDNGALPFSAYYYRLPFLRSDAQLESRDFLTAIAELGFFASEQLFGQRYQVTSAESPGDELLFQWENLRVYRLKGMPGRMSVIYRLQSVEDAQEQLSVLKTRIAQNDFYFGRDAVVDEPVTPFRGGGFASTQVFQDLKPTELLAQVDGSAPGLLVLSDNYYPGWHAYLDGQEVPIHRANFAVRGVDLPAGAHLVSFRYDPVWLRIGLAISALGLPLLLFLITRAAGRARSDLAVRLSPALRRATRSGRWLVPVVSVGGAAVFAAGFSALPAPAIPPALHDAGQWAAANTWAADRCAGTIAPAGTAPDLGQPSSAKVYGSWDAIEGSAGTALDRMCVIADLSASPRPENLEPPPGWQKSQVGWFGTIWVAQYLRQESLMAQIPFRQGGSLGEAMEILGFAWPGSERSGDTLHIGTAAWPTAVQLFMRTTKTTPTDYRVFVQLLDTEGRAVSVSDHQPRDGARPTSTWSAGEIMTDSHQIARPQAASPGDYLLIAGIYDEKTKTRLRTPDGEDHVVLARIGLGAGG